jgi:hypothetical protein
MIKGESFSPIRTEMNLTKPWILFRIWLRYEIEFVSRMRLDLKPYKKSRPVPEFHQY